MKMKLRILIGTGLLALQQMPAWSSVMSLAEAKDRLSVVQRHEATTRQDYLLAKANYNQIKRTRKAAQREVKAIAKANAASVAAEQAALRFGERASHFNPYLDEQYLGAGNARIKGWNNEYQQ